MLAPDHRMRRSRDFSVVVRSGARARRGAVVLHQRLAVVDGPAVVGLIVGRAVGGSVVRHRVSRRLRAQAAARVEGLPHGSGLVIRALPAAAAATSADLGRDLDAALSRLAGVR